MKVLEKCEQVVEDIKSQKKEVKRQLKDAQQVLDKLNSLQ